MYIVYNISTIVDIAIIEQCNVQYIPIWSLIIIQRDSDWPHTTLHATELFLFRIHVLATVCCQQDIMIS